MRIRSLAPLLIGLMHLCPAPCQAAPHIVHHPTRQQLAGAWRLVSIDVSGEKGPVTDPFYQANSVGLIIYDPSGWMSVQISAPQRQAWPVPASRPITQIAPDAALKSAAFDTYYAYFGTWTLDARTSVVTHHVIASLLPAETGLDYAQGITLEGDHLTFTGKDVIDGEPVVRTKKWQRIAKQ